jgi:hypothetical protein
MFETDPQSLSEQEYFIGAATLNDLIAELFAICDSPTNEGYDTLRYALPAISPFKVM